MTEYETQSGCLVCRKQRGELPVPGGAIYEDHLVFISHAPLFGDETEHYIGHIFLETKRHVPELADLSDEEAREVGLWSDRTARALIAALGMEHVYAFFISDGVPHVHLHLTGRYPGAPREYWGPRVDEWPDAPKGGVEQLAAAPQLVREWLQQYPVE